MYPITTTLTTTPPNATDVYGDVRVKEKYTASFFRALSYTLILLTFQVPNLTFVFCLCDTRFVPNPNLFALFHNMRFYVGVVVVGSTPNPQAVGPTLFCECIFIVFADTHQSETRGDPISVKF